MSLPKNIMAIVAAALVAASYAPTQAAPMMMSAPSLVQSSDVIEVQSSSTSRKRVINRHPRGGQSHNGRPDRGSRGDGPSYNGPSHNGPSSVGPRHHGERQSYNRSLHDRRVNGLPPRHGDRLSRNRHWDDRWSGQRLPWNAEGPSRYKTLPRYRDGLRDRPSYDRPLRRRLPWNAYGPSRYNPSPNSPTFDGPWDRGSPHRRFIPRGDRPWDREKFFGDRLDRHDDRPWRRKPVGDWRSDNLPPNRGDRPADWNGNGGPNQDQPGWDPDGSWYPPVSFNMDIVIDGPATDQSAYSDAHLEWCYEHYRSYRADDNTFRRNDGARQQCFSPYY